MKFKTIVEHWHYEDGWRPIPYILQKEGHDKEYDEGIMGWHCWVYPGNGDEFIDWVEKNMASCDYSFRFNSGDPMYIIHIKDPQEAILFKLTWM